MHSSFLRPHPKVRRSGLGRIPHLRKGLWALVATGYGRLGAAQLEAVRKTVRRRLRREGHLRLVAAPFLTLTAKPAQSRMGRGKGRPAGRVSPVRPGQVLLTLAGLPASRCRAALSSLGTKLSLPVRILSLHHLYP